MANKLSISQIGVNQGLAQIKTNEMFVVASVDLDAKKATLKSVNGEEKVVSKATLERWYRELSAEEVIELGKVLNNNGGSQDEVQEQNESEAAEENVAGETADAVDADAEADGKDEVWTKKDDDVMAKLKEMYGITDDELARANHAGESGDGNGDVIGEADAGVEDVGGDDAENDAGAEGDSAGSGDEADGADEEVTSPITPSNAGKDKDKAKEQKKQEPKNAALMKVRQTIIDTILNDSPSIQLKKTTSYDVLREKHNFAEITHGSNRFNVSVMSKCLTEDQMTKVKINPASFGWSIDADFTVFDETDIEMAVQLIRQSRDYRLANPVTRKKKEKK